MPSAADGQATGTGLSTQRGGNVLATAGTVPAPGTEAAPHMVPEQGPCAACPVRRADPDSRNCHVAGSVALINVTGKSPGPVAKFTKDFTCFSEIKSQCDIVESEIREGLTPL